jgi:hypothetical protein
VGALWAARVDGTGAVVNISKDGALLTSPVAMPPDSVQPLHLKLEVTTHRRPGRHVRRVSGPDEPIRYLVGVEFLSIPPALARAADWSQT